MAYNKNLYTSSTDALDAGIIYDTNITKMQSEINAMLNKYMVIIGEATFDEEAVDPQTSQTTQYYDFSPESGSSDTINLVDGDVVLIKFPQAHPFLTTNHNRIWILTNAGYTSYLVSSGDVTADRAYQTHFAFKFNGTFLIPFDINGAQEHYNELKTSIIQATEQTITSSTTGTSAWITLTGLTTDHVVGNWGLRDSNGAIPENAPPCDIEIETDTNRWRYTLTSNSTAFYLKPTFIKD